MPTRLLIAPAAVGKTAYVLELAQDAARDLRATPRVVVPTHLQVRAWRRRMAEAGGAIGVRVLTFDGLYAECLNAAGEAYTELSQLAPTGKESSLRCTRAGRCPMCW